MHRNWVKLLYMYTYCRLTLSHPVKKKTWITPLNDQQRKTSWPNMKGILMIEIHFHNDFWKWRMIIAWGQASKSHLEKILILQKRAVRLISFLPYRMHAIPYFAQSTCNILPITMLYFKLSSVLMFDITTNSAPQNICNLFYFYTRDTSV